MGKNGFVHLTKIYTLDSQRKVLFTVQKSPRLALSIESTNQVLSAPRAHTLETVLSRG